MMNVSSADSTSPSNGVTYLRLSSPPTVLAGSAWQKRAFAGSTRTHVHFGPLDMFRLVCFGSIWCFSSAYQDYQDSFDIFPSQVWKCFAWSDSWCTFVSHFGWRQSAFPSSSNPWISLIFCRWFHGSQYGASISYPMSWTSSRPEVRGWSFWFMNLIQPFISTIQYIRSSSSPLLLLLLTCWCCCCWCCCF